MKTAETPPLGVACRSPEDIWQRMLVSHVRLLGPEEAFARGYGEREVIVPDDLRPLTDKELRAILVPPETPHAIKYVKVAASIGEQAVAIAQEPGYKTDPQQLPIDFGHGVVGHVGGTRYDGAHLPNVATDGDGLFVGEHIDNHTKSDPGMRVSAVLNMGPGRRWHRIAPDFTLEQLPNGPGPASRNAYMRELLAAGKSVPAYWFGIEPPYQDPITHEPTIDVLVNSPVATCLHDGSTIGSSEGSQVAFIVDVKGEDTWQGFAPSI